MSKVIVDKSDLSDDQLSSDFMNLFEDSTIVKVPSQYNITKEDMNLTSNEKCYSLIDKCRYWMMNTIPDVIIQYMKTSSNINEEFKVQIQNDFNDFFGFEIVYISENDEIDEEATGLLAKDNRQWLIEYYHKLGKCKFDPYALYCAAYNGHTTMIKFLRSIGCDWEIKRFFWSGMNQLAVKNKQAGNYDLTYEDYLFLKNYFVADGDYEDDSMFYHTCAIAAGTQGHLECLKYIIENDCFYDQYLLRNVACFGRIEILKYLLPLPRMYFKNSKYIYNSALSYGHIECYKFLIEYFINKPTTSDVLSSFVSDRKFLHHAILKHDVDLLKYMISKGINYISYYLHNSLILTNRFDLIKIMHENNVKITIRYKGGIGNACEYAVFSGNLEMLKYFKNIYDSKVESLSNIQNEEQRSIATSKLKYYSWDNPLHNLCDVAILNGNLEMLQFLLKNGCKWSFIGFKNALRGNHLDCIIYMLENGYEIPINEKPNNYKHRDFFSTTYSYQWVFGDTVSDVPRREYQFKSLSTNVSKNSEKYTYLDILKYFNDNYDLDKLQFNYYELVRFGNLECIKYVVDSGLLVIDIDHCKTALLNTNPECIKYILSQCELTSELFTFAYQTADIDKVKMIIDCGCPIGERKQKTGFVKDKATIYQEIDDFLDSLND